jgi:alcohol dehydrogenase class IV
LASALVRPAEEVQRLGARRVLVLATPSKRDEAEEVARRRRPLAAGVCAEAAMHVAIEKARAARDMARHLDADCCVTVGGGSTIGLDSIDEYLDSNTVFAVKDSLICVFERHDTYDEEAKRLAVEPPFCTARFDFVLKRFTGGDGYVG